MKITSAIIAVAFLAGACSDIPKDTEGSLQMIRERGAFRVGLIAGSKDEAGRARQLIDAVAADAGARPQISSGAAEQLLTELEEGELDLVVGTMAAKSPWALKVHALSPLDPAAKKEPVQLLALARNGENAWVTLLHHKVEGVRKAR